MKRTSRSAAVLSVVALTAGTLGLVAGPASAVLPSLPDNIVVFPNRDFVTVEGFDLPGAPATLRVYRGDTVVGQSSGLIDPAGGVAFEVNHPGGWCWGQDSSAAFQVTPDIVGNDRLEIELTDPGDGRVFDVPVADVEVVSESRSGTVVTTVNRVPADVPLDRLEARIIAPDLKDTPVARRDARATADGPGAGAYDASLVRAANGDVVATYTFDSAETAQIALAGGARIMSWAVTTGAGDRLGITIAEHEELGGPGMGGCPLGPNDAQAPAPGNATVSRIGDGSSLVVDWTPSTQVAGAPAITGYQVTATDAAGNLVGRTEAATARTTTIAGLSAGTDYTVEVRAATNDSLSKPFAASVAGNPDPNPGDTTPPGLRAAVQDANGSVTLSSPDPTAEIHWAINAPVLEGDQPSADATRYTGPVEITLADSTLNFVAIDAAGNTSLGSGVFQPGGVVAPDPLVAPTLSSATAGAGSVDLAWSQVTGAASYQVTVADANGPLASQPGATTARVQKVSGLTAGRSYSFTVKALSTNQESAASNALSATPTAVVSQPQITRAQWKAGDFRIEGITDVTSGSVQIFRYDTVTRTRTTLIGTVGVAPAVAPLTGGNFLLRLRNNAAGPFPGTIVAVANDGAVSPPFTVTRR